MGKLIKLDLFSGGGRVGKFPGTASMKAGSCKITNRCFKYDNERFDPEVF